MIYGIGTDLTDKRRIQKIYKRYGHLLTKRILSEKEIKIFQTVSDEAAYLAKRFSAKEAIAKALKTGFRDHVMLTNISVLNDTAGAPVVELTGKTEQWVKAQGIQNIHVSLSDEKHYTLAFAILTSTLLELPR